MKRIIFASLFAALCANAGNARVAAASNISPIKGARKLAEINPTPENYLNLSLIYYSNGLFEESVSAAKLAMKLRPKYAEACNVIGAAYNSMKMWNEAIPPLEKALSIKPDFQLARNNLNLAINQKAASGGAVSAYISPIKAGLKAVELNPTPENQFNLSFAYYTAQLFDESVSTAKKALKLKPDYAEAYNIIGAAYNNMQMWDEAITALEKAVRINPNFQLAKNNLALAKTRKAAGWGR